MPQTFTPTEPVDLAKEKDWPASLGLLDWDSTKILFTKRTLIEFLKYSGITVDPNFTNISKLPRYAKFGKLETSSTGADGDNVSSDDADAYRPSRRVRTVPGGPHTDIFKVEAEGDALSLAPPKPADDEEPMVPAAPEPEPEATEEAGINFTSSVRPSRRVRTVPGGASSVGALWDAPEPETFKPTRRVRERPGGQDNIDSIF
ncbi:hypothetical protein BDN72DRAFT_836122 [Pluteus cervinus]|uniref:Uncharacterized protein n=1 Tax=Pluteus cervinus TaxID=181527 RepID=A0ACD3B3U8_9AGAR|nr:hypothetical protein BDN72DRAFT_836122 [Pluteus cervinus]